MVEVSPEAGSGGPVENFAWSQASCSDVKGALGVGSNGGLETDGASTLMARTLMTNHRLGS